MSLELSLETHVIWDYGTHQHAQGATELSVTIQGEESSFKAFEKPGAWSL